MFRGTCPEVYVLDSGILICWTFNLAEWKFSGSILCQDRRSIHCIFNDPAKQQVKNINCLVFLNLFLCQRWEFVFNCGNSAHKIMQCKRLILSVQPVLQVVSFPTRFLFYSALSQVCCDHNYHVKSLCTPELIMCDKVGSVSSHYKWVFRVLFMLNSPMLSL